MAAAAGDDGVAFPADERVISAKPMHHVGAEAAIDDVGDVGAIAQHGGQGSMSENHIARSGREEKWIGVIGSDDQIGETVAVDITRGGYRKATLVVAHHAIDAESVVAIK